MRLFVSWWANAFTVRGLPATISRICSSSSAMPAAPAPEAAWYVEATRRFRPLALWRGATASSMMAVVQFGLAITPLFQSRSSAFTCGTTSGTSGSWRKARELSIIFAPAFTTASRSWSATSVLPAKSTMSSPSKLFSVAGSTWYVSPSICSSRSRDAKTWTLPQGNLRSFRTLIISVPTAPTPTRPTLYSFSIFLFLQTKTGADYTKTPP